MRLQRVTLHQLARHFVRSHRIEPSPDVDGCEFAHFMYRITFLFAPFLLDVRPFRVRLRMN